MNLQLPSCLKLCLDFIYVSFFPLNIHVCICFYSPCAIVFLLCTENCMQLGAFWIHLFSITFSSLFLFLFSLSYSFHWLITLSLWCSLGRRRDSIQLVRMSAHLPKASQGRPTPPEGRATFWNIGKSILFTPLIRSTKTISEVRAIHQDKNYFDQYKHHWKLSLWKEKNQQM